MFTHTHKQNAQTQKEKVLPSTKKKNKKQYFSSFCISGQVYDSVPLLYSTSCSICDTGVKIITTSIPVLTDNGFLATCRVHSLQSCTVSPQRQRLCCATRLDTHHELRPAPGLSSITTLISQLRTNCPGREMSERPTKKNMRNRVRRAIKRGGQNTVF